MVHLQDPNKHLWDFDESGVYDIIYIENHPYKVLKKHIPTKKRLVANKLHKLRKINDTIVKKMSNLTPSYLRDYNIKKSQVDLYKNIHDSKKGHYLLSEMKTGTGFEGLNKPKDVHKTTKPKIGPDGNKRAEWRDIFMVVNTRTPKVTRKELELFIHELAHTLPNHVTFRHDDHGPDFQDSEELLWDLID